LQCTFYGNNWKRKHSNNNKIIFLCRSHGEKRVGKIIRFTYNCCTRASHIIITVHGLAEVLVSRVIFQENRNLFGGKPLRLVLNEPNELCERTAKHTPDAPDALFDPWFSSLIKHLDRTKAHRKLAEHTHTRVFGPWLRGRII